MKVQKLDYKYVRIMNNRLSFILFSIYFQFLESRIRYDVTVTQSHVIMKNSRRFWKE